VKRFRFPLRPVGVLRAHRELQARQALAAALGLVAQADAKVAAVRARAAELERSISEGRGTGFRADLQVSFLQNYRRERGAEVEAVRLADLARIEAAKRRQEAIVANRNLKIVTRLEDKARAAHRTEMLRAEQSEIDERAASAAARQTPRL
jgi:flagellar FliJ protein